MSPTRRTVRTAADEKHRHEALDHVFEGLEEEHRALIELLEGLPQKVALERPGGEWSAVDSLIHVTSWKENALRIARQQAEPGAPDPGLTKGPAGVLHVNVDRFNAEALAARSDWSLRQALIWANEVHRDLLEALHRLPEERLLGGRGRHGARMWYWMPGFIHSVGLRRELSDRLTGTPDGLAKGLARGADSSAKGLMDRAPQELKIDRAVYLVDEERRAEGQGQGGAAA